MVLTVMMCWNYVSAWSSNQMKYLKVISDLKFFFLSISLTTVLIPFKSQYKLCSYLVWIFFLGIEDDYKTDNL